MTSSYHVIRKIGVPTVVTRDMEENWVSKRQVICEENRDLVIEAVNLEFARFVAMSASICDATFVPAEGSPPKPVTGKRSLRKSWFNDGSPNNARKFSWMLYFVSTFGHRRFREGKDWATWKEECFMQDGNFVYEAAPGQIMPRHKCVKTMFSRCFNQNRKNVLATAPHGARLQSENPHASKNPTGRRQRFTRRNTFTFFYKESSEKEWMEVRILSWKCNTGKVTLHNSMSSNNKTGGLY
jgi:hypothetical protein